MLHYVSHAHRAHLILRPVLRKEVTVLRFALWAMVLQIAVPHVPPALLASTRAREGTLHARIVQRIMYSVALKLAVQGQACAT